MRFKPPSCKRLQGAADVRRRARRCTFVLQVPDDKTDVVPCERLQIVNPFFDGYFVGRIVLKTYGMVFLYFLYLIYSTKKLKIQDLYFGRNEEFSDFNWILDGRVDNQRRRFPRIVREQ